MSAQLVALNDGPNILLDKPILLVGRHPECDIQIDSRKISRRHCCVARVNDYLVVRDLGSTNGVRINGVRITEGRLSVGDELTIGNHRYQVAWDVDFAPAPHAQAPVQSAKALSPSARMQPETLLESSDEPVPLSEVSKSPLRGEQRPRPENPAAKAEKSRPPTALDESLILPDNLDLAPSDVFRGPPGRAS